MRCLSALLIALLPASSLCAQQEVPKVSDPRLVVELFAQSPDIVHPIACDFDAKGRLLVIESHTHFAPKDYKGPKFDRIRLLEDTKGTGKADRITTYFEGTRHTMDIAVHPDGSVYVATRNEILRLRDTKGLGKADEKTRIVFLDTKGDYPHNGLSGLCFDSRGDLIFGMGENLGAKYTLLGADGAKFSGQGDGGHVFRCTAEGKKLRRMATGFWNPFGSCRDIFGRLFTVDNDPDQMPPCRMVHVVEGGDYGFQFRYGRSGKHPFQSWHGQLPGTLPMMTGVGEAPCEILSYESDGLPKEYRGQLLVTSWADHRVERYAVKPRGASFQAERLPFVQGGKDFRPVGLATAPDGSLFVTDWVLSNYTLHGKGAVWHVRQKDAKPMPRPEDPKEAIFSMHRPLREAAARKLAGNAVGRKFLSDQLDKGDVRVNASVLTALIDVKDGSLTPERLGGIVKNNPELGMRELALRDLVERRDIMDAGLSEKSPPVLLAAAIKTITNENALLDLLSHEDPFIRNATVQQLAREPFALLRIQLDEVKKAQQRVGIMLAWRTAYSSGKISPESRFVRAFLRDKDETVRFLAVKWIADEKLADYRDDVEQAMKEPKLSVRTYTALATALARLDGQEVSETRLADYFAQRLAEDKTPPALRVQLLRQVPATHPRLTVELLAKLLKADDAALKFEAVRALAEHPSPKRSVPLLTVFRDRQLGTPLRAFALLGLAERAQDYADELTAIAKDKESPLRADAVRALIGVKLKDATITHTPEKDRPAAKNLDAWLKRLEGPGDAEAGMRVFFHPKLGGCYKCHRIDGRGQDVGPDLSGIGTTDRRHLLESILQPSNTVAPHYQVWQLETADGKVRNGMLLNTNLDEYTYLDAKGGRFQVNTRNLVEQRALPISIMPDGLVDGLTDQEIRDLLAYLQSRK